MEKPGVASASGGPLDTIVDGEKGFLVLPKSPGAFAEKIVYLLENKDVAQRMGKAARKRIVE